MRTRTPASLDFDVLQAALQAFRAASVRAPAEPSKQANGVQDPLVELLTGGPNWREAVGEQGGSFNRSYARRGGSEA
jgi:hypothetical protein